MLMEQSTSNMGNSTASPLTTDMIARPQTLEDQYTTPEVPINVPARRGKFVTETDWPIILRLYITQDISPLKVKETLSFELGFNITQVQLLLELLLEILDSLWF